MSFVDPRPTAGPGLPGPTPVAARANEQGWRLAMEQALAELLRSSDTASVSTEPPSRQPPAGAPQLGSHAATASGESAPQPKMMAAHETGHDSQLPAAWRAAQVAAKAAAGPPATGPHVGSALPWPAATPWTAAGGSMPRAQAASAAADSAAQPDLPPRAALAPPVLRIAAPCVPSVADASPAGEAIDAATPEAAAPDTTPTRASVFFETTAEGTVLWLRDAGITASTAHPLLEALLVQAQRAGVRIAGVRINGHPAEASPSLSPTRRNPWPSTA